MSTNKRLVNWTPDLVERVRVWWEIEGLSASQIATLIGGGATRNTVIGKAHRQGWEPHRARAGWPRSKRPPKPKNERSPPRSLTARPHKPKPPKQPRLAIVAVAVPRPPASPAPEPGQVPLLALKPYNCRWPVNSPPRGGQYLFCGLPKADGPYCEMHHKIAFTGTTARSKRVAGWTPRPQEFR